MIRSVRLSVAAWLASLVLVWSGTALAQDYAYRSAAYSSGVMSAAPTLRYDAMLGEVASKYYPNRGMSWALQNRRPQFVDQLAEVVLDKQYPELHVDKLPNHKYSDVWARCSSGSHCINGRYAFQVKIHQDGDPAKYFRDFNNANYEKNKGFIIPREHRKAARKYAREHGRPDIARKITDDYDLSKRKLDEIADDGAGSKGGKRSSGASGYLWVSIGIQVAMLAIYAAQTCTDGVSLGECAKSLAGVGASMIVSNLAARGISSFLVNTVGLGPQWAGRITGMAIAAVYEVYFAYSMYGLSKDFLVATAIGLSAAAAGMAAGSLCIQATSASGPLALIVGAGCGAVGYGLVKLAGNWIWRELSDKVVDRMEENVAATEATLAEREQMLRIGATETVGF